MGWLKNFINNFFENIIKAIKWCLEFLVQFAKYVIYTVYDGFLTVITTFIQVIDLSQVAFNMAASYSSMPPQLIWLINQVNIPQAMSYIGGAMIVRMILNIIPAAVTRI